MMLHSKRDILQYVLIPSKQVSRNLSALCEISAPQYRAKAEKQPLAFFEKYYKPVLKG